MKRKLCIILITALSIWARSAYADCSNIIALSKIVHDTVQDSSQIASYARSFCSEYASGKNTGRSTSFGVAFSFLSASFGEGSVSEERVASRYCDATKQDSVKTDAYRQYVETIAPGAYEAFTRCEELRDSGLTISVDRASVLPQYFAVAVSFRASDALATQIIDYAASPGVKCRWNNGTGTKTVLKANSSDALTCLRQSATAKSAVHIVPTSKPNSQLSFAWDRYQDNLPVDTLKDLRQQVSTATAALTQVTRAINSSVVAFALPNCPEGWKDYEPAYGRFVRGIDKSKGGVDPDGPRTPGTPQSDEFAAHSHSRPNDVFDAGNVNGVGAVPNGNFYGYGFGSDKRTGDTGGAETRPRNVALLYCTPK